MRKFKSQYRRHRHYHRHGMGQGFGDLEAEARPHGPVVMEAREVSEDKATRAARAVLG